MYSETAEGYLGVAVNTAEGDLQFELQCDLNFMKTLFSNDKSYPSGKSMCFV